MLNSNLPFGEEFSEEATDGLFIIKIAIMVPLPHLRAHLDEEIESAGAGPVHHLSGGWAVFCVVSDNKTTACKSMKTNCL